MSVIAATVGDRQSGESAMPRCDNCGSTSLRTIWLESDEFGPFDAQPILKCQVCGSRQYPTDDGSRSD